MKNEKLESLIENWEKQDKATLMEFGRVFWDIANSYEDSLTDGLELLNLKGYIKDKDIPAAAKLLRKVGITEFTATSGWTDAIARLRLWDLEGFKIVGFKDLHLPCGFERKNKTTPAIHLKAK